MEGAGRKGSEERNENEDYLRKIMEQEATLHIQPPAILASYTTPVYRTCTYICTCKATVHIRYIMYVCTFYETAHNMKIWNKSGLSY